MIKKLLIANRGEIAVRVIQTAREMGIKTVAVASDADLNAMHANLADECVHIGPSEPAQSYLSIEKIIDAARSTGADAIHPGYGFLSERVEFSKACQEAGIKFLGPSAESMQMLGAKIDAKKLAESVQVPITPGFFEPGATDEQLIEAAIKIGFPVLLKASAGGGGRGMRVVRAEEDLKSEIAIARDEAIRGFGNGEMMVEKLIERPRHIEVQMLADTHGNRAALFERECSLQRRHQKLVEEAPSVLLNENPELWQRMREATLRLMEASNYTGAGTAEFMVDEATGEFYFLEVNARLQVEHPVTEAITGIDLVRQQILVASGLPIEVPQAIMDGDRSAISGHAIEARIVAEDPAKQFLPSTGKILAFVPPNQPGVRVDTGFDSTSEVSRFYDSLLAKCIVHAQNHTLADEKLTKALQNFHILGVKTNIAYLLEVIQHLEFKNRQIDTGFLGRVFPDWTPSEELPAELADLVQSAALTTSGSASTSAKSEDIQSAWSILDGFRIGLRHNRGQS